MKSFFWGSEYYAYSPPFVFIVIISLLLHIAAFRYFLKEEPERTDAKTYGLLASLGFALLTYAVILRINLISDTQGLQDYRYHLMADFDWFVFAIMF